MSQFPKSRLHMSHPRTPSSASRTDPSPFFSPVAPMLASDRAPHPDAVAGMATLSSICTELMQSMRELHAEYTVIHSTADRLRRVNKNLMDQIDDNLRAHIEKSQRACVFCGACEPRLHPLLTMKECTHTICTTCIPKQICATPGDVSIVCKQCPAHGPQPLCVDSELLPLSVAEFMPRPLVPISGWATVGLHAVLRDKDIPDSVYETRMFDVLTTTVDEPTS